MTIQTGLQAPFAFQFSNITSATTTLVKTGQGILKRIVLNKGVASGAITVYDSLAASGTKIATITEPATLLASQNVFDYGCAFTTGLTILTAQADDITIIYS